MHTVIRVIVKAKTKDDALGEARCAFEDLCGEGKSFDYFTMFDEDEPTVSGKARYGSIPAALKVSTKAGAKMVREGMEITRREFNEKLAKIREGLAKYTADELFEGESKRFPKDPTCSCSATTATGPGNTVAPTSGSTTGSAAGYNRSACWTPRSMRSSTTENNSGLSRRTSTSRIRQAHWWNVTLGSLE